MNNGVKMATQIRGEFGLWCPADDGQAGTLTSQRLQSPECQQLILYVPVESFMNVIV
jgi:hypothetical protein